MCRKCTYTFEKKPAFFQLLGNKTSGNGTLKKKQKNSAPICGYKKMARGGGSGVHIDAEKMAFNQPTEQQTSLVHRRGFRVGLSFFFEQGAAIDCFPVVPSASMNVRLLLSYTYWFFAFPPKSCPHSQPQKKHVHK